jgi:hypothetical protein
MESILWILLALFCAYCAFSPAEKSKKQNDQQNDDDENNDEFMDTICMLGAMDIVSDGELDGNFSDEY